MIITLQHKNQHLKQWSNRARNPTAASVVGRSICVIWLGMIDNIQSKGCGEAATHSLPRWQFPCHFTWTLVFLPVRVSKLKICTENITASGHKYSSAMQRANVDRNKSTRTVAHLLKLVKNAYTQWCVFWAKEVNLINIYRCDVIAGSFG